MGGVDRKSRRILHLFYEPLLSGVTRHVIHLLRGVGNHGYEFWVLCSTSDPKIPDALAEFMPQERIKIVPPGRFFSVQGFFEARRMIRSNRIDTLHIHNLQSAPWAYAAGMLCPLKKIIFTPQINTVGLRIAEFPFRQAWRLLRPITNRYIAVSPTQQDFMIKNGVAKPDSVRVIPNHIDGKELRTRCASPPEEVRRRNRVADGAVVVCQAARLDRQKNPFFLVRVAAMTRVEAPEAVFMLIGEGPLRSSVEKAIRSYNLNGRVRLMGYRDDVAELMNAADIVSLTSRWEGLPHALLEGISCSKPIVATDIPGNRDLVEDGRTGFLVTDEEEFAEKIILLAKSRRLRKDMGRNGFQRHECLLDPAGMTEQVLSVYEE